MTDQSTDRQTNSPTDRPTDGRTDGLIGKCHFQYYALHDIIILHHLTFIHLGAIELSLNGLCTEFALLWGGWENNGSGIISRNQIGRSDASRISVFPFCLLVSKCIKQFIHMILIFLLIALEIQAIAILRRIMTPITPCLDSGIDSRCWKVSDLIPFISPSLTSSFSQITNSFMIFFAKKSLLYIRVFFWWFSDCFIMISYDFAL